MFWNIRKWMLKLTNPKSKVSMRKFQFEKVNLFVSSFDMTVFLLFLAIIFFCFLGKKDLDLPLPPYDVTSRGRVLLCFNLPLLFRIANREFSGTGMQKIHMILKHRKDRKIVHLIWLPHKLNLLQFQFWKHFQMLFFLNR